MTNPLKRWMGAATPIEKTRLAKLARTSLGTLQQQAGGYRTEGRVSMSADLAARVEKATQKLVRKDLPVLHRADLCEACGRCEFAREAKKAVKE